MEGNRSASAPTVPLDVVAFFRTYNVILKQSFYPERHNLLKNDPPSDLSVGLWVASKVT